MNLKGQFFIWLLSITLFQCNEPSDPKKVPDVQMQKIYEEIKTPYKYGLVLVPADDSKMIDSPTIFRSGNQWFMTYIIFDGIGYETWLAESDNLLDWNNLGKILSFSDSTHWDSTQKAGYLALQNYEWGGDYQLNPYEGKYWMSYLGGNSQGYEAGLLSIGVAATDKSPSSLHEWDRLNQPVLMAIDQDVRWWENRTLYKSSIIWDKTNTTGHPFVMYYNAKGDSINPQKARVERIGMAVSDDMVHWERYLENPVLNHHRGITGDAYLQKIDNLWVMFYFGASWTEDRKDGAFNLFACSYDLVNWTDWEGEKLIAPSKPYDQLYAHKPFVLKWKGVVYHFYCAVNEQQQRGLAVASSKDLGKSSLSFVQN